MINPSDSQKEGKSYGMILVFLKIETIIKNWIMINSQKFNKTRTIEDKQNQRDILAELKKQNELLSKILEKMK